MFVASTGWWLGSIIFIIVWIAIAFWPARVAARKAIVPSVFPLQSRFLPRCPHRGLPGQGSATPALNGLGAGPTPSGVKPARSCVRLSASRMNGRMGAFHA